MFCGLAKKSSHLYAQKGTVHDKGPLSIYSQANQLNLPLVSKFVASKTTSQNEQGVFKFKEANGSILIFKSGCAFGVVIASTII